MVPKSVYSAPVTCSKLKGMVVHIEFVFVPNTKLSFVVLFNSLVGGVRLYAQG